MNTPDENEHMIDVRHYWGLADVYNISIKKTDVKDSLFLELEFHFGNLIAMTADKLCNVVAICM